MKEPLLKDLWTKAMSKELHQLAQGCPGITKGTNTIFYLSQAEILSIPKDRTVTYGRIVIDLVHKRKTVIVSGWKPYQVPFQTDHTHRQHAIVEDHVEQCH